MVEYVEPFAKSAAAVIEVLGVGLIAALSLLALASAVVDALGGAGRDAVFRSIGVLAIVVVIRTFLSFTLELEMTGR